MASTSAITSNPFAGITVFPGVQVSPFGAGITNLKAYNFTMSTSQTALTSTGPVELSNTVSGLTTNDIPFAMYGATGPFIAAGSTDVQVNSHLRVSAANTLAVQWTRAGTATGSAGSTAAISMTLFTMSYFNQASSTTT